ncbi:MAG: DUF5667 domain-containing protein [Gammaproteobacteria bacterium]
MRRGALLLCALLAAGTARAGHGLLNSFNDIEWLAAPGTTPVDWYYPVLLASEDLALRLTTAPEARATRCFAGLRQRLAEALVMVKQGETAASRRALEGYTARLACLEALARDARDGEIGERLAQALLEQRYMISVEYPDLPPDARAPLEAWMSDTDARYLALRATLPKATAEALFFKEEEVRWSWEMARRAVPDTPPPDL